MTSRYEEALAAAGVPFQLRGAERFFDRTEVRQAVNLLRVAARTVRLRGPARDPASAVRPVLTGLGLTGEPPGGRGKARERWESLDTLAAAGGRLLRRRAGGSLADLAAELELRSALGHAPGPGGVTLASLHAAKGLEWDVVFLPCLTDGAVPIVYAQSAEAIEEERRLLYVGDHQGQAAAVPVLVAGQGAGRQADQEAVEVPRRAAAAPARPARSLTSKLSRRTGTVPQ